VRKVKRGTLSVNLPLSIEEFLPVVTKRSLRLLIVEDSEDDAFLLANELRRGGFAPTYLRVDTPTAMRTALKTEHWDVITSDHAMPFFSAPEALSLAQELRPETPFIIVSGELNIGLAVKLMKGGAHDYIQKREMPLIVPAIERELAEVELRRQRWQAEEERLVSEEKFFKAFHNSPDAINLTRLSDGVYLEVNEGAERLSGYKAEEMIGRSTINLNIWADPADRERLGAILLRDGKFENEEIMAKVKDGTLVPAIVSSRLITINGETCVLSFTRDIREQKRAEEEIRRQNRELKSASQKIQEHAAELEEHVAERTAQLTAINQELESLTYTIAHDLRAPLRAISGYSQILLEDYGSQFDTESTSYLERIMSGVTRMHQRIDEMLMFSSLSQVVMKIIPVDLSSIAFSVSQDLQQRLPEREINWQIAKGLRVNGDKNMLHTVLENLLENAWKFTMHQPQARIEFGVLEKSPESVYFVRDNGAGFSQESADRLFGIFQRLHDDAQFPGIGIGLASVKRIIERHGGRVWAESEVNQGATFYFTINEQAV